MNEFRLKELELVENAIQGIEGNIVSSYDRKKYKSLFELKHMLEYDNLSVDSYHKYNNERCNAGLGSIKISKFRTFIGADFIKSKEMEHIQKRLSAIDNITKIYSPYEKVFPGYKEEYEALLKMREILNSSSYMTENDIEEYRYLRNDLGTTGSKISKIELYELFRKRMNKKDKFIKKDDDYDDLLIWKIANKAREDKKADRFKKIEEKKKHESVLEKKESVFAKVRNRIFEFSKREEDRKSYEERKKEREKKKEQREIKKPKKNTRTIFSKFINYVSSLTKHHADKMVEFDEEIENENVPIVSNLNCGEKLYKVVKTTPWEWTDKKKKAVLIISGISLLAVTVAVIINFLYPSIDAQVKAEEIKMIINNMDGASALWKKVDSQNLRDMLHLHNKLSAIELKKLINLPVDFNDKYEWVVGAKNIAGKFIGGEKISSFLTNVKGANVGLWQALCSALGITGGALLGVGIFKSNKYNEIIRDINNRDKILEREGADIDEWANIIKKKIIYSRELTNKQYRDLKDRLEETVKNFKKNEFLPTEEIEKRKKLRRM